MHAETDALSALNGARYVDLVAKTAKVSLKDVRRILLAIDALRYGFSIQLTPSRCSAHLRTPSDIAACERAHQDLMRRAEAMPRVRELLHAIQDIKRIRSAPHADTVRKQIAFPWSAG